MWLVLRAARRLTRLRVPGAGGTGRRPRRRHRRGPRGRRLAPPGAGRIRRSGRGAMRFLHARTRRRHGRPAPAEPGSDRGRDPRGALREPLPLHRLREDLRRGAAGRGAGVSVAKPVVGWIGESVRRSDGVPKTTGQFEYASDLHAAGMLWGHTLRSPHPHALVRSIDLSAALRLAGVHAVLTHADVPGRKTYGLEFVDQPVLAIDRVRYFGEPVAIVAAEHPEQARRAAEAIVVDYEPLPPVVDPELATSAEPLHPDRETHELEHYLHDPRPNVVRT